MTRRDRHLILSARETRALLSLARKGRVLLDVDPTFLRDPRDREAARSAVNQLRRLVEPSPVIVMKPVADRRKEPA